MTALPMWLTDALDRALPEMRGRERDELAEVILAALPNALVVETIATAAKAVLERRGIAVGEGDLAREIASSAGGSVMLMLQVGDDECAECGGSGFVEYDAEGNEGPCGKCAPKALCGVCLDGRAECPVVDPPGQTQWTCLACGRFVGEVRRGA
jgi:hypothetical protein